MEPPYPRPILPSQNSKSHLCPHSSQPEILEILTPKPISTPFLFPRGCFRLSHHHLFTGWQLSHWSFCPLLLIYSAFFPKQSSKNIHLIVSHPSMTVQWLFVAFSIKSQNCLTKPLITPPDTLLSTLTYFPSPSCSLHISNTNSLLILEHLNLFSTSGGCTSCSLCPESFDPRHPQIWLLLTH